MTPWYNPLLALIPQVIIEGYNYVMGEDNSSLSEHRCGKIPDRTTIDEEMRNRIRIIHAMWSKNNKRLSDGTYLSSQHKLAAHLNSLLGLNKSTSYYRRIFNDK